MDFRTVRWILIAILAALVVSSLTSGGGLFHRSAPVVSYTAFERLVKAGDVKSVVIRGHEVLATLAEPQALGPNGRKSAQAATRVPAIGRSNLLQDLRSAGVSVTAEAEHQYGWLVYLLPWLLMIGLYFWFWRRMMAGATGAAGPLGRLTQSRAREAKPEATRARFDDVAGQDAAKREVSEIVDFLRNPERYLSVGADVPHGVLLVGPPGTGKTLMARAVAGEAEVPFFHMSGSEFIEMVVGVGAARVRQTFGAARAKQPSILFIDEIDAVGRVRGSGLGGGNDEREQTLNQILDAMDGFSGKEAVIVLAATNRPDVLDPALLRPGRFDRRVTLDLPDRAAREAVLEVHTRKKPIAEDVDLGAVAAATPGFSGADLRNLANEAAILAAREHSPVVSTGHFIEARDKIVMGPERPLSLIDEDRHRIAVHESGHTAVAHHLPGTDPLFKVTIIPRGQALGGTHQLPEHERYVLSEPVLRDRLSVMLAGRAAERLLLGDVSSGADADIRQATRLARSMVTRWGMDESLGPVDLRSEEENPFLGLAIAKHRVFSDVTAYEVDEAVKRIVKEAEARATETLEEHRAAVDRLVAALEESETLDRDEIEACLSGPPERRRAALA